MKSLKEKTILSFRYERIGKIRDAISAFELFIQFAPSEYYEKVVTAKLKIKALSESLPK
jgi:hypothetical protein